MAVSEVKKVRIYGTKKRLKHILRLLKNQEFIHVERLEKINTQEEQLLSEHMENLEKVRFLLDQAKKLIGKEATKPIKLNLNDVRRLKERFSLSEIYSNYRKLQSELSKANTERGVISSKIEALKPWLSVNPDIETLRKIKRLKVAFGSCKSSELEKVLNSEELRGKGVLIEIQRNGAEAHVIWIGKEETPQFIKTVDMEHLIFEKDAQKTYSRLTEEFKKLEEREKETLSQMSSVLKESMDFLKLMYDELENLRIDSEVENQTWKTKRLFVLEGWIENKNLKKLSFILKDLNVFWEAEAPAKGDNPPVKLSNPPQIKHFEDITRLYSLPSYYEIDPTPFLAPFFAMFFGICLTDAVYGVFLMVASLLLYKRMKSSLLIVLFWGGFFALVFGALTGGWLSNLVPMLSQSYPWLVPLKNAIESIKVLDPLKDILLFIGIAIAFGYVHLFTGLLIGIANHLRNRNYLDFLSQGLAPLQFLLAIGFAALSNLVPSLSHLKTLSTKILLASVGVFIVLAGLPSKNVLAMIPSGLFAFYLDGVGILSDLLSYSRLMALGLATGVIGMAINIIAKLVLPTPAIGIIIFILVIIGGHLFNLAMNALGGFIHTARLHFVEFFGKFYTGGGRPFVEYREIRRLSFIENQISGR